MAKGLFWAGLSFTQEKNRARMNLGGGVFFCFVFFLLTCSFDLTLGVRLCEEL